ncbi:MAG TPA: biopolymer transporter ExbD [Opitutus sp.]|nr:biopolymer transporter ExbD [Opitutus sp.]
MITRPLDLAARLRAEPRNFDYVFFVNCGLIVLFFTLFGSRFVLAPGLGLDFQMPQMAGARAGATTTEKVISVRPAGQIFAANGLLNLAQLREWLRAEAAKSSEPSLLVRASADVPVAELTEIASVAREAGFVRVVLGAEEPPADAGRGR